MANGKEMTEIEITSKIKAGKSFIVATERERKKVLTAAKFFGLVVKTKENDTGTFDVLFCKP